MSKFVSVLFIAAAKVGDVEYAEGQKAEFDADVAKQLVEQKLATEDAPPAKVKTKKVRVLADCVIDGEAHKPNAVVEVDVKMAKVLVAQGSVDDTDAAVAYAESLIATK